MKPGDDLPDDELDLEVPPVETRRMTVPHDADGVRLDRYLAEAAPDLSRTRLQALIKEGRVRVSGGGTVSDTSTRVKSAQTFLVEIPPPEPAVPEAQDIRLNVVFEDADLIVVNKPAGLVVHPGAGNRNGTLVNALLHHCGVGLKGVGGVLRPGIVHRIDKDTSGLLVAAKTDRAHAGLAAQFADHSIDRLYQAAVLGLPEPLQGTIDLNLARDTRDRKRFTVVRPPVGKLAVTHYRVLSQIDLAISLIECRLETGRTHQIRVHMADIGHPLIGDRLYGRGHRTRLATLDATLRQRVERFPRQALHATTLGFRHPVSGEHLRFEAAPPEDLKTLLADLALFR